MPDRGREQADWTAEYRRRIDELIDEYRTALHDSLNDLTEDEARERLVPSKTTLLGLVKHVTFVEGVWFDQAVTGRSYKDIGIASTVDGSFTVRTSDTIASVQAAHRERCRGVAPKPRRSEQRRCRRGTRDQASLGTPTASPARTCPSRRPRRDPARASSREPLTGPHHRPGAVSDSQIRLWSAGDYPIVARHLSP